MRGFIFSCLLITFLASIGIPAVADADPGDTVAADNLTLVVITNPATSLLADLLAAEVMVLRDLNRLLLVAATESDFARLDRAGADWTVLPSCPPGRDPYTAGLVDPRQRDQIATAADLLWSDDQIAVFAATPDQAAAVSGLKIEIARVFWRPIRASRELRAAAGQTEPAPLATRVDFNPVVAEAVALVDQSEIDGSVQRLQDFVTRYASHDSCVAAANWIASEFEAAGIEDVYFHEFSSIYMDNVVAELPGVSEPDKIIVIGGHYDSTTSNINFAPGADDNASGTSCILEVARILSQYQFDYTIKFVAFGGEELGLYGSEGFAADAAAAGDDIVAAVAVDMIGYLANGDTRDLDIIDNGSSVWLRDLVFDVVETYVPELAMADGSLPGGASSDHASFWAHGYDAILFFEDTGNYSPYIHTSNDVVGTSYNDPELAVRSVRAATALIATLARPFQVAILHTPLGDTADLAGPYPVEAEIIAAAALDPGALFLHYTNGVDWHSVALSTGELPNQYVGEIPGQPDGSIVSYYISAADVEGNLATHPVGAPEQTHRFFVGAVTTLLATDFEQGDAGWTVGDAGDDATTGIWLQADPTGSYEAGELVQPEDDHSPDPGVLCFVTGNAPAGSGQGENDVDGGRTTLLSPTYELSDHEFAWVRYHRWYTNDTGNAPGSDVWQVSASADDGQSWQDIELTSASDRSWREVTINLNAYYEPLPDVVRFRFIATDELPGSIVEAGVDDFSLLVHDPQTTAVGEDLPPAVGALVLGPNVPNPFNPRTTIRLQVGPVERRVSLRIHDVSGRLVRTLLADEAVLGTRDVLWDGTDDHGRSVASGTYFSRLVAGQDNLTRKMLLVR